MAVVVVVVVFYQVVVWLVVGGVGGNAAWRFFCGASMLPSTTDYSTVVVAINAISPLVVVTESRRGSYICAIELFTLVRN